jgi:hypothetical protein
MSSLLRTLRDVQSTLGCIHDVLGYGLQFLWAILQPKAYHVARPHQCLDGETPIAQDKPPEITGPSKLVSIPILGGLHHRYVRVAA